jgi:hypothetical protein
MKLSEVKLLKETDPVHQKFVSHLETFKSNRCHQADSYIAIFNQNLDKMEIGGLWSKELPSFRQTKLIKYKVSLDEMKNTKIISKVLNKLTSKTAQTTLKSKNTFVKISRFIIHRNRTKSGNWNKGEQSE